MFKQSLVIEGFLLEKDLFKVGVICLKQLFQNFQVIQWVSYYF